MDVRIGVTDHPREIAVTLGDDADRDAIRAQADAALTGAAETLWLTDDKGGEIGVPAAKIAFVEIGPGTRPSIGFG